MKHRHHMHPLRHNEAFTMVIVAALFIAFAVIGAIAVERNSTLQLITRRDATVDQLRRLSTAIIEYGVFNSGGPAGTTMLYPCPAQDTMPFSSPKFGVATQPPSPFYPQACYNTANDTAVATTYGIPIMPGGVVLRGMVPVATLAQFGIGVTDAYDAWNNRIEYVVNRKLTVGSPNANIAGAPTNNPTVTDSNTGYAIPPPDFILISYGRDGLGALRRGNATVSISCPSSGTVLRQYNCSVTNNFYFVPTYTAASASSASYFDDILSYYRQ